MQTAAADPSDFLPLSAPFGHSLMQLQTPKTPRLRTKNVKKTFWKPAKKQPNQSIATPDLLAESILSSALLILVVLHNLGAR